MRTKLFSVIGLVAAVLSIAIIGETQTKSRGVSGNLRSDQVRTRHVINGAITSSKIAFKVVAATVTTGTATVTTSIDATIAGGTLVSIYPTGNQDQLLDNVVLNANGSITVTLAANATANNTFNIVVVKPNGQGIS